MAEIHLNKFIPRPYQLPIFDAIENKGYKRVLAILPRRSGKDMACWNLAIRACLRKVQTIFYILPTYAQAKKVIWNSITNDGDRFLDYIPKELVSGMNSQEMIVRFKNGSQLQLVGSDNYDSLMGTNPGGIIMSEYALQDPMAWMYLKPILAANDGFAVFISTPRRRNHLFDLYQIARQSDHWFTYLMTVEQTGHIPLQEIDRERTSGEMSEDLIQQEYYCSFASGEGFIYAKYMDQIRLRGQIGQGEWDPGNKIHTAWDIGVRDETTIIFFQKIGSNIHILDVYSNSGVGLEHYIKVLKDKPYIYGKHIGPHDLRVREWAGGAITRWDKARQLGITFTLAPQVAVEDGIESVRSLLPRTWFDEASCKPLLKALDNYRYEVDSLNHRSTKPVHDQYSHFCDAMRYLALSISTLKDGISAHELESRYIEASYGQEHQLPSFFRNVGR